MSSMKKKVLQNDINSEQNGPSDELKDHKSQNTSFSSQCPSELDKQEDKIAESKTIFNLNPQSSERFTFTKQQTAFFSRSPRRISQKHAAQSQSKNPSTMQTSSPKDDLRSSERQGVDKMTNNALLPINSSMNQSYQNQGAQLKANNDQVQKSIIEEQKNMKRPRPQSALLSSGSKQASPVNQLDQSLKQQVHLKLPQKALKKNLNNSCQDDQTFGAMMAKYKAAQYDDNVATNTATKSQNPNQMKIQAAGSRGQPLSPNSPGPLLPKNNQVRNNNGASSKDRRSHMQSIKTASFGVDGYNGSPAVHRMSTQELCSPALLSIQSPQKFTKKLYVDNQKKQTDDKKKTVQNAKRKMNLSRKVESRTEQIDSVGGDESSLPPLLSKLTFCQLSNNSEDINEQQEQISLRQSSRRGAQTPHLKMKQLKHQQEVATDQSDQLSLILPRGMAKTSSYTYTGMVSENRRRENSSKNQQRRDDQKSSESKRSKNKDTAVDRFPINHQDAAMTQGGISANTSDAEPLFNSRSASYFVLQSQLRDIQHDAESQSHFDYDRLFMARSEHLEQYSLQEDGTPKTANTLTNQMKAIQNKIQLSQKGGTTSGPKNHRNGDIRNISSTKSYHSSAQVSDNKNQSKNMTGANLASQQQKFTIKKIRNMPSSEDVTMTKNDQLQRKYSLQTDFPRAAGEQIPHPTANQIIPPHASSINIAQNQENANSKTFNDSQLNQNRPPLGPNVPKKAVSIFWNGAGKSSTQQQQQALQQQCLSRTLTVSDQLLASQQQALRQGGLGEAMHQHEKTYCKLRTQVGSDLQFRGTGGRKSEGRLQPVLDEVVSRSSHIGVNFQSNQTMSNQLKQLSTNRSNISSNNNVANKQNSSSQFATSSEKQDGRNNSKPQQASNTNNTQKKWKIKSSNKQRQDFQICTGKKNRAASSSPIYQFSSNNTHSEIETPCTPQQHSKKSLRLIHSQNTQKSVEKPQHHSRLSQQHVKTSSQPSMTGNIQQSDGTVATKFSFSKNKKPSQQSMIGSGLHAVQIGNSLLSLSATNNGKSINPQKKMSGTNHAQSCSFISQISSSVHQSPNSKINLVNYQTATGTQRIAPNQISHLAIEGNNIKNQPDIAKQLQMTTQSTVQLQPQHSTNPSLYSHEMSKAMKFCQYKNSLFLPQSPQMHQLKHTLTLQPPRVQADAENIKADRELMEKMQGQLQEAKRQCNILLDKNKQLTTRIGYLSREVSDRDKLMQKFVLNNESEAKLKEQCVIKSYKSKLASVERKLESSKKQITVLKQENGTLKENESLLNVKLQQLCDEKDMLHNECVKMSQRIFTQQHERHQRHQLEGEMAVQMHPNSSILNIETTTPPLEIQQQIQQEEEQMTQQQQVSNQEQQQLLQQQAVETIEERRASLEQFMNQHRLLECAQTIDQFKHMSGCDTCNFNAKPTVMCEIARKQFPVVDPIEFSLLRDDDSIEQIKSLLMRLIKETRSENHNLRLMLLQEMQDKQIASQAFHDLKQQVEEEHLPDEDEDVDENVEVVICETEDIQDETDVSKHQQRKSNSPENKQHESRAQQSEKMRYYLEELRVRVIEQQDTIKEFKRELQRLYAPKVKIILQIICLQDEALWKNSSKDPRANVERAKEMLKDVFYLSEKVLDDSFFKTFMRSFEPIFQTEIAQMTQKIMDAMQKQQKKKSKAKSSTSTPLQDDQISSFHRVVAIQDLEIRDRKLKQFARYLAHQTLQSEEKLSIEIQSHLDNSQGTFSLQECVKHLATQRSTQASDQIDEVHVNSLITKLQQSQMLEVFFSTLKTTDGETQKPMFVDCNTFRSLLGNLSDSTEESRAAEQLLNLLKVRTIGEQMVDLSELINLMNGISMQ